MTYRARAFAVGLIVLADSLQAQWPAKYLRPAFRGTVTDSLTGKAVARATFSVRERSGIAWTDSSGRYLYFDAPVGDIEFALNCPVSRGWLGKSILTQRLHIGPATDTIVNVRVDASRCQDFPATTRRVDLVGHYTSGFETSILQPCVPMMEPESSAYRSGGYIWVESSDSARIRPGVKWPKRSAAVDYPVVYLRVIGDLTGPGAYGHLGGATYKLKIAEVLEARVPAARDCR